MKTEKNASFEMSLEERQNSLALHRANLVRMYDVCVSRYDSWLKEHNQTRGRRRDKNLEYYLGIEYSLASCLAEVNRRNERKERILSGTEMVNNNWAASLEDEEDDRQERYAITRMKLCQKMHFIDSIILRICNNNIDPSVLEECTDVRMSRPALMWLFCDFKDAREYDVQDINRFLNLIRLQIFRDNRESSSTGTRVSRKELDRRYEEVVASLYANGDESTAQMCMRGYLSGYKRATRKLIREIFGVYDEMQVYRRYLQSTELYDIDDTILEDSEKILALAETIKRIFTERFTTYMKLGNLNLSHCQLNGAWFSRSELSDSNFVNSSFAHAHFDNAVVRNCDLSICDFTRCDAGSCDFSGSNLNYSNLSGANLRDAILNNTQMSDTLFRDPKPDRSVYLAELLLDLGYSGDRDTKEETIEQLISERTDALEYLSGESAKEIAEERSAFVRSRMVSPRREKNTDSINARIFRLTSVAGDPTDPTGDRSTHIYIDKDGRGGSVLDDAVALVNEEIVVPYAKYHASRIISPHLFTVLREIESRNQALRETVESQLGRVCLRTADLTSASLKDAIIAKADLSHVPISDASFSNSDLSASMFYYTQAGSTYFGSANLSGSDIYQSDFSNANFAAASAINASFVDCNLTGVNFSEALLLNSVFVNSGRTGAYMSEIAGRSKKSAKTAKCWRLIDKIDDAAIDDGGIGMSESDWTRAVASGVTIIGMNIDRSHLDAADMKNAVLFNCLTRWSSLERTDMSYAILTGVSMHQSSLQKITLSKSKIFASEFSGCRMNNANFIGSRCEKALFSDVDLSGANFSHALIRNCTIFDANLSGVNVANALFVNCVFVSVDLNRCIGLENATFIDCIFFNIAGEQSEGRLLKINENVKLVPSAGDDLEKTEYANIQRYSSANIRPRSKSGRPTFIG